MGNVVKMEAVITGTINGESLEEYKASGKHLSFGGYSAVMEIKGKERKVNFDWISHIANIVDNKIVLEAGGKTPFGGGPELDDCYEDEYKNDGFGIDDLTAAVMSKITEFDEFVIYGEFDEDVDPDLKLESVKFSDGEREYVASITKCNFNYQTD